MTTKVWAYTQAQANAVLRQRTEERRAVVERIEDLTRRLRSRKITDEDRATYTERREGLTMALQRIEAGLFVLQARVDGKKVCKCLIHKDAAHPHGTPLDLSEFGPRTSAPDGLQSRCKKGFAPYMRQIYAEVKAGLRKPHRKMGDRIDGDAIREDAVFDPLRDLHSQPIERERMGGPAKAAPYREKKEVKVNVCREPGCGYRGPDRDFVRRTLCKACDNKKRVQRRAKEG